ncbi:MAG: PrsW family glutamic-type intramembrane protease [Nitrospinota bacterium]
MTLLVVFLGFAPGIVYLVLIRRLDKYEREPWRMVLGVFALGAGAVIPAGIGETLLLGDPGRYLREDSGPLPGGLLGLFFICFLVVGPVEELLKFLAVRLTVFRSREFNEPMDGLVYAAASALGFASLENVFYILKLGAGIIVARALFATLGHLFFSCLWGFPLGMAALRSKRAGRSVLWGLLGAMFLHGLYNYFLLTQSPLVLAVIPLMLLLGRRTWRGIKEYQRISPFREGALRLLVRCPHCTRLTPEGASFCTACGGRIEYLPAGIQTYCGRCQRPLAAEVECCPFCGYRLKAEEEGR